MPTYRGYFFDRGGIVGRHDFDADDDAAATWIGAQIYDASSDLCDDYEVWSGSRRVRAKGTPSPMAEQIRDAMQRRMVETEEAIVRSEWTLARSRRLLARLNAIRKEDTPTQSSDDFPAGGGDPPPFAAGAPAGGRLSFSSADPSLPIYR